MIAWIGSDRVAFGGGAASAFSAEALIGGVAPRSSPGRHVAPRGLGGPSPLLRAINARYATAGAVLVFGTVLAAAVSATDGTIGRQPDTGAAWPDLVPGQRSPAALPGAPPQVQPTALSAPTSAVAPGAGQRGAASAPDAARAGDSSPGGSSGGAGPAAVEPAGAAPGSGPAAGTAPPHGSAPDEQRRSPVEQGVEPVERATEPVTGPVERATEPVTGPVERATEPVTGPVERATEPVTQQTQPVEDADQPALSMLDSSL